MGKIKPSNKVLITILNALLIVYASSIILFFMTELRERKHDNEQNGVSRGVFSLFVTISLFMIVTAVIGIVGAWKKHARTLYVESCFYIFLVSLEAIVFVGAAIFTTWFSGKSDLRVHFYRNSTVEDDVLKQQNFWDDLQYQNDCCGADGPQDYAIINRDIPPSCCARAYPLREGSARRHLHATCLSEKKYYMRGCEAAITKFYVFHRNMIIAYIVTGTFCQINVTVLSIIVARKIRAERRLLQQNLQAHFES